VIPVGSMKGKRIFLVDDDASVLNGLSLLLRQAGYDVQSYQSPGDFLDQHDANAPGCAIFDVVFGDSSGLDIQQTLATRGDTRPIIFITGRSDIPTSVRAMKAGAVDFLTKPVREKDLLEAVDRALERDRLAREEGATSAAIRGRLANLTPREREVLGRIIAGRMNKQIAGELRIAEKTVKVHRARVMSKMAVRSVAQLVQTMQHAIPARNQERVSK
jgi:FixJ family two-component response regulator